MSNADFEKLIGEYSLDYCLCLEAAYGDGMMSEGGAAAICAMFESVDIRNKTALDIGAGLGGVANYLGRHFNMNVTGLEINAAMVAEANRLVPESLKNQLSFQIYHQLEKLPFNDQQFDIVFSKGVLTHVKDKLPLFKEVNRILKKDGKFVINDWLSPTDNQWGHDLLKMCERENLTLYAHCETTYQKILAAAGFKIIRSKDETAQYSQYNQQIVKKLVSSN